jgi:hypothetical protein
MDLRNTFIQVRENWEDYGNAIVTKAGAPIKVTDTDDPIYSVITKDLPAQLSNWNNQKTISDKLMSKGSPGEGNKNLTPWIATFHKDITVSAKKGFYLVYLYSGDLKNLYLSIAFGVTKFEEIFGRGKKSFAAMRSAASNKRNYSKGLLDQNLDKRLMGQLINSDIDVARGHNNFLHKAYGDGTIFSIEYDLDELPSNEVLEEDYQQLLDLYISMASDLSSPDDEELAVNEAIKEEKKELTISHFQAREPRKISKRAGSGTNEGRRRSKKSHIVGNEGEELVFNYEKKKLEEFGLLDKKVIWCAQNPEDRKPGYDILSFNESGEEIYIEVKATEGKKITSVNLTFNEWKVATDSTHREKYFIYLVFEALTKPRIEVIENPCKMVDEGSLEIKIADYDLRLNPSIKI